MSYELLSFTDKLVATATPNETHEFTGLVSPQDGTPKADKDQKYRFVGDVTQHATEREPHAAITVFVSICENNATNEHQEVNKWCWKGQPWWCPLVNSVVLFGYMRGVSRQTPRGDSACTNNHSRVHRAAHRCARQKSGRKTVLGYLAMIQN